MTWDALPVPYSPVGRSRVGRRGAGGDRRGDVGRVGGREPAAPAALIRRKRDEEDSGRRSTVVVPR